MGFTQQVLYPGCLANTVERSTKWLPKYVLLVVYFVEMLVSEDYPFDSNVRESCGSQIYAIILAVRDAMSQ